MRCVDTTFLPSLFGERTVLPLDTSPVVDEMAPLQPGQCSRQEETAVRTAASPEFFWTLTFYYELWFFH